MIRSLDKEDPDSDYFGDPEDLGYDSNGKLHEGWAWSDRYGWTIRLGYEFPTQITCYPILVGDKGMKE